MKGLIFYYVSDVGTQLTGQRFHAWFYNSRVAITEFLYLWTGWAVILVGLWSSLLGDISADAHNIAYVCKVYILHFYIMQDLYSFALMLTTPYPGDELMRFSKL